MSKHLAIVIPVYNEERNILPMFQALKQVMSQAPSYRWSALFVDDGSTDDSVAKIKMLSEKEANIQYIELSRNFGKEVATTAGLIHATGEGVVLMDADLQHPPATILEFIARWEKGADIVIGLREQNKGEGVIKRLGSKLFYRLMHVISETEVMPGETDFRLIDRRVVDEFKAFTEHSRMTRTLLNWLGFKKDYVTFTANARTAGKPGYSLIKLVRLALNSFIANSLVPLKLAGYLGVGIMFLAGIGEIFIIYVKYIAHDPWGFNFSGPATLAMLNLFLAGIMLACIGLVALYVGSIHEEVSNRPLFVIRSKRLD